MIEDITIRFYKILDNNPDSPIAIQFKQECERDPRQLQQWYDFLIEQHLSGNLNNVWSESIKEIPQLREQITFQQHVQRGIRHVHDQSIQDEVRRILPKRPLDNINRSVRRRRLIILAVSIAAVALLCIGVLVNRFWNKDSVISPQRLPIVMIEEFRSEGVTEDMLVHGIPWRIPAKLATTDGIHPLAPYAVVHATNRAKPGESAEVLLSATHAVRGSFRRVGDDFQVEASLVDVAKNEALWKELFTVDNTAKAFDDLYDKMSLKVANAFDIAVNGKARVRLKKDISSNINAMHFFLAGERQWAERTDSSLLESIASFQKALELDSTSTTIRGFLALAYSTYVENDYGDSSYWTLAVQEAKRVLRKDADNPEALLVLGDYAESKEKQYQKAAQYFEHALKIQPGDAKVHQAIAELYLRTGDISTGEVHIRVARQIEPEHLVVRWIETKYLTALGRLEDAKLAAEDLLVLDPKYPNIQNFFWQYHLSKGEYELAINAIPDYEPDAQWREDYMLALTYVDQNDEVGLSLIYPKLRHHLTPSIDLLRLVQDNEWEKARQLLRSMLEEDRFGLIAIFQSSDFAVFNKMKEDHGIRQILAEFGIRANVIPDSLGPEF